MLVLVAIDKRNGALSLAISVHQRCERAFRTQYIYLRQYEASKIGALRRAEART